MTDQPTLLVAEDDPHISLLVSYALESLPCTIEIDGNGKSVLERVRRDPRPALVLLDLNLPGLGGMDVLRAMKADESLCRIPVFLLSASMIEANRNEALSLGAERFIEKPFDVQGLAQVVGSFLARRR